MILLALLLAGVALIIAASVMHARSLDGCMKIIMFSVGLWFIIISLGTKLVIISFIN